MMKSIYFFFLISGVMCAFVFPRERVHGAEGQRMKNQEEAPKLKIQIPGNPEHLTWNTTVRYTISVSDPKDGESRYGEIDSRAVVLELEYAEANEDLDATQLLKDADKKEEHKGLGLMKRSTCFGCHADKTRLAGP